MEIDWRVGKVKQRGKKKQAKLTSHSLLEKRSSGQKNIFYLEDSISRIGDEKAIS